MAAPRIPYSHIDSTRKVTHNYTRAERQQRDINNNLRDIGNNLGRRYNLPNPHHYINKRHIPLKRLPYNGLLFKYMILESNPLLGDAPRRKDLIAQLLNALFFDSIRYDAIRDRFVFCMSTSRPKMKYFYTSPIASVGVAGWGNSYNIEICCRISREVDVAYLKGGTHYDDDVETDLETITQRGSKLAAHRDFDYLRIINCDRVDPSCGKVGENNDVCLVNHPEIIDNEISGIYCMAAQDSLIGFNDDENRDNLYSNLMGPGRSVSTAFNQIYTNIILPLRAQIPVNPQARVIYDSYMVYINTILLTLEADYRLNDNTNPEAGDRGYLGFSEVTLFPLGHHSINNTQKLPNPALMNQGNPAYLIGEVAAVAAVAAVPALGQPAVPAVPAQTYYEADDNNLVFIINNFYLPMFIIEIVGITDFNARIDGINNIPVAMIAHDPDNLLQIRQRNCGIFKNGCNNFNIHNPMYSVFHNMFISRIVFGGIDPLLRKVSITKRPGAPNPGVAANLIDYVNDLNESTLPILFLAKAIMFQVNHKWRNNRNGRLIYLATGGFNHHGPQPSISRSVIDDYNDQMINNNDVLINPIAPVDHMTFTIPGYRQLLTNKNGNINSPLFKLRWFLHKFDEPDFFLTFTSILTRASIDEIINYLDNIPAGRITLINDGAALAGGYRKKTRRSRINKKKTYRKRNKRM
jgi:hypothetical protein